MVKKKDEIILQIANVSLLSIPNAIEQKFEKFKELVIKPSSVRDFEVNTDESMEIAENTIKKINGIKTDVRDTAKELKDPLNAIKKIIIDLEKMYDDDLTMSKSLLNTSVTLFKELKAATLKASEEADRLELEKEVKRKADITNNINRILSNFTSLLFGGDMVDNEGGTAYADVPQSVEDIQNVREYITDAFPDFEIFQEFQKEMIKHYGSIMNDIESYKKYVETGNVENIRKLKMKYYALCERSEEQSKKMIERETSRADKQIESNIKQATKGIRTDIKYDIENIVLVPERFKIVDHKKMTEYKKANKEKIEEAIKNNTAHDLVPGIKFRYERKNVAY